MKTKTSWRQLPLEEKRRLRGQKSMFLSKLDPSDVAHSCGYDEVCTYCGQRINEKKEGRICTAHARQIAESVDFPLTVQGVILAATTNPDDAGTSKAASASTETVQ